MAFIQGVRLDKVETRDQQHGLTKIYKKGRTFFKAVKSSASGAVQLVNPLLNILTSAGVISSETTTKTHIKKGVVLTCSVIKTPKTIAKIFLNSKEATKMKGADLADHVVKIASDTAAVALGIMTCFKLGDTIVALFSALSSSLGVGFKVAQGGISTMLPFIGVFSAIEIVKSMFDAGTEGIKLYKTAKKISATTKKMKIWKNMDWTDPAYISKKLERMKVKQIKTVNGLEKLEGALATSAFAFNSHVLHVDKRWDTLHARKIELSKRNPVVRLFGQIAPQIKLTVALLKKEAAEKKHLDTLKTFNKISAKHTLRTVKIRNFTIVEGKIKAGTLNARDLAVLEGVKKNQLEKLKTKKSNLKVEAVEHGLKIGLKIVVVISLVAAMALTFSGVGTAPGIITSASVALFVMAAEYGLKKFKEYNPPKEWIPVHVPTLLEGSDEKIGRKVKAILDYSSSDQLNAGILNGKITLIGTVKDLSEKDEIERKLRTIDNVNEIDNQITVEEPIVEI